GVCIVCNKAVPNCSECFDNKCVSCEEGFYLNSNNTCESCGITNCTTCEFNGTCDMCTFDKTLTKNMTQCSECESNEGCLNCLSDVVGCSVCREGYYLVDHFCERCGNKCTRCDSSGNCVQCETGYSTQNGVCVACHYIQNHCSTCVSSSGLCTSCDLGYMILNTKCEECGTYYENSDYCNTTSVQHCKANYFIKNAQCVQCSVIYGCMECNENNECIKCDTELNMFNNNGVMECSSDCNVDGCTNCNIDGVCSRCDTSYTLDKVNNKCIKCWDLFDNCGVCNQTEKSCAICDSNVFYLEEGVCKRCSNSISNCEECSNKNVCMRCVGNYHVVNGKCVSISSNLKNSQTDCTRDQYFNVTCVDIPFDSFKYSETEIMKCERRMFGCSSCQYKTSTSADSFDSDALECSYCKAGYAFDSEKNMKCIETTEMIDEKGVRIHCQRGCVGCTTTDNCPYADTIKFTARNFEKVTYSQHQKCNAYRRGYGCVECSSSIVTSGVCLDFERNSTCSVLKEVNGVISCIQPIVTTKDQTKSDDGNCEITLYGSCKKCDMFYYLGHSSPQVCLLCTEDKRCGYCQNSTICEVCASGYVLQNGTCENILHCADPQTNWCNLCEDGYYLSRGVCIEKSDKNCVLYSENDDTLCLLCKNEYLLSDKKCVSPSDHNCEVIDSKTSTCIRCQFGYQLDAAMNCVAIPTPHCISSLKYDCLKCDLTTNMVRGPLGDIVCSNNISDEKCLILSTTGCVRCKPGYYIKNGRCVACNPMCRMCVSQPNNCVACQFGYYYNTTTNTCLSLGDLMETCELFLPSGDKCSVCKSGYYMNNGDCVRCSDACEKCITNSTFCLTCNKDKGYYYDLESTTTTKCKPTSLLLHCSSSVSDGCSLCETGFYLNLYHKCVPCMDNCQRCGNSWSCETCKTTFVLNSNNTCIVWTSINKCVSYSTEYQTCSKCSFSYRVSSSGNSCEYSSGITIALVVPLVFFVILFIVVICALLLMYFQHRATIKAKELLVNSIKITDAKMYGLTFTRFGGIKSPLVCSETDIEIATSQGYQIPVNKLTQKTFLVGNDRKRNVKVQFTQKEEEKFTVEINPSIVTINKGMAVEVILAVKPMCTCDVSSSILVSFLELRKAKIDQVDLNFHFSTEISTRLDPQEIQKLRKLGEGSFGIVYEGIYRGEKVAIKMIKDIPNFSSNGDEFEKEVQMLDKFRSDYIINFFGAVFIPKKRCMVTEFAKFGSLQDVMRHQKRDEIGMNVKVKMLLDAARGIEYLHNNRIIHRDIKPDNILVLSLTIDENVLAKLTDFGTSRNINVMMGNISFTKGIGTPVYMAPEILNRSYYKEPADIYSFAITMLETITWEHAFPKEEFKYPWNVASFISSGKRPESIRTIENKKMREVIEACWGNDPVQRLPITAIVEQLSQVWMQ
ncbi:protein kinase domain containing protein, partial [Entamoeba invadens IP1]